MTTDLLSQASDAPAEWLNFGTAGVVVVSFLLGWIWPRPAVDRIIRDCELLREEVLTELRAARTEHQAETRALRAEIKALRKDLQRDPPP